MIKLIIFDFDDTLVDSKAAHFIMDNVAAKNLGFKPVTKERYYSESYADYTNFIKSMFPGIQMDAHRKELRRIFDVEKFKTLPNAKETLDYLSQKYKLGILSSKENGLLRPTLDHLGLSGYFSYIHGQEDSQHRKPDPRVFDKIIAHFNLKKEEVAYIGDMPSDRDAAIAADIFFVGINECPKEGILWCDSIEGLKKIF